MEQKLLAELKEIHQEVWEATRGLEEKLEPIRKLDGKLGGLLNRLSIMTNVPKQEEGVIDL